MQKLLEIHGETQAQAIISGIKQASAWRRGFMATFVINALKEIGLIEQLQRNELLNVKKIGKNQGLHLAKVQACLDYLYELDILAISNQDEYTLTEQGRALLQYGSGLLTLACAYTPTFSKLASFLKQEAPYNIHTERDGKLMGQGSGETGQYIAFPLMMDLITKHKYQSVLDLGCGSASFLIKLCSTQAVQGWGLDYSQAAITHAQAQINKRGLEKKITVFQGDLLQLDQVDQINVDSVSLITAFFVLHEFFKNDGQETQLIQIINHLHQKFPQADLAICEAYQKDRAQLHQEKSGTCEHHLFHRLSGQGIPKLEQWQAIFSKSGANIKDQYQLDIGAMVFFILSFDRN
jgi:SAM-dependent methyltransferase/predicted transcriptional regulator